MRTAQVGGRTRAPLFLSQAILMRQDFIRVESAPEYFVAPINPPGPLLAPPLGSAGRRRRQQSMENVGAVAAHKFRKFSVIRKIHSRRMFFCRCGVEGRKGVGAYLICRRSEFPPIRFGEFSRTFVSSTNSKSAYARLIETSL